MRCRKCGREIPGGIPNCPKCGEAVSGNIIDSQGLTMPLNQNMPNYRYQAPVNKPPVSYAAGAAGTAVAVAKKGGSAGLIIGLISSAVFIIGIIATVIIITVGSGSQTPEDTLKKFETAYNNMDAKGLIECIEPRYQRALESGNDILSSITGIDILSIADLLPFVAEFDDDMSEMPKITVEVVNIEYSNGTNANSDSAEVAIIEHFDDGGYEEDTVPMVKEDGKWYISGEY